MIEKNNKLTILHDDNGVFADYSGELLDFSRDTATMALDQSNDYLYIGYYKPINGVYVELSTANTNANTLAFEYYNESTSAWTAFTDVLDETKGFTRSGFIKWNRNLENHGAVEVNGISKHYIRIRPSVTHSSTVIMGINLVFSDDRDLEVLMKEITGTRYLPGGQASHILSHVAARNEMVQKIRNDGRMKRNLSSGDYKKLDAFDFLDIEEIREASANLTLSIIFMNLSDRTDDSYMQKSSYYRKQYNSAFDLYFLELDFDDDGEKDTAEQQHPFTTRLVRR